MKKRIGQTDRMSAWFYRKQKSCKGEKEDGNDSK